MIKDVHIEIYKAHCVFFINEKVPAIKSSLEEYNIDTSDELTKEFLEIADNIYHHKKHSGACFYFETQNCYIVLKSLSHVTVLAHECLHAVNHILNYVGVKFDSTNDEAHCYLLEYLMEQVLQKEKKSV